MKCPGVAADAPPVLGVFQTGRSGLTLVGVLTTAATILRADDPQTEVRNALTDWVIDKVADRVITAVVNTMV